MTRDQLEHAREARTVTVKVLDVVGTTENSGLCLEVHDLAASKLYAYREKDRDFVRTLLVERLIDATVLRDRIEILPADGDRKEQMDEWVRITAEEL